MNGTIYIAAIEGEKLIKIGFSTNVQARLATLKSQWCAPFTLIKSFPGSFNDEQALHGFLSEYRGQGPRKGSREYYDSELIAPVLDSIDQDFIAERQHQGELERASWMVRCARSGLERAQRALTDAEAEYQRVLERKSRSTQEIVDQYLGVNS